LLSNEYDNHIVNSGVGFTNYSIPLRYTYFGIC